MSLKKKVKELEIWVENISNIQSQLLKELGYQVKQKPPVDCRVYISKIDKAQLGTKKDD